MSVLLQLAHERNWPAIIERSSAKSPYNDNNNSGHTITSDFDQKQSKIEPFTKTCIEIPGSNDVISGRGPGIANHQGNKYYRELVKKHKKEYVACHLYEKKSFLKRFYLPQTTGCLLEDF